MTRIVSAFTLIFFMGGCDAPKQGPVWDPRVDAIVTRIEALEKISASATQQAEWRDLVSDVAGVAYLTPGSQGFSAIKSSIGMLMVSMENVVPYANGSRVTLSIGNPLAASLEGMKLSLSGAKSTKRTSR